MGQRQGASEDRRLEEPRQATRRKRELDAISDQKSMVSSHSRNDITYIDVRLVRNGYNVKNQKRSGIGCEGGEE